MEKKDKIKWSMKWLILSCAELVGFHKILLHVRMFVSEGCNTAYMGDGHYFRMMGKDEVSLISE